MTIALVICILLVVVLAIALVIVLVRGERRVTSFRLELQDYKVTHTQTQDEVLAAREHAVRTSAGTNRGNAAQHLAPYMPEMIDRFAPGDWRFLGSPIDFVVFDGLSVGRVTRIVLVEVKTSGPLSRKQSLIKAGIDAGAVSLECEVFRGVGARPARLARPPAKSTFPTRPPGVLP
jgi:predicted Holliday junction resolvase-like endonuclease